MCPTFASIYRNLSIEIYLLLSKSIYSPSLFDLFMRWWSPLFLSSRICWIDLSFARVVVDVWAGHLVSSERICDLHLPSLEATSQSCALRLPLPSPRFCVDPDLYRVGKGGCYHLQWHKLPNYHCHNFGSWFGQLAFSLVPIPCLGFHFRLDDLLLWQGLEALVVSSLLYQLETAPLLDLGRE